MRRLWAIGLGVGLAAAGSASALGGCSEKQDSEPSRQAESTGLRTQDSFDAGSTSSYASGSTGHGVPFPGVQGASTATDEWGASGGTPSQLIVADALALCTVNGSGQPRGTWVSDAVLSDVRSKMSKTLQAIATANNVSDAGVQNSDAISTSWLAMRVNQNVNFNPVTQANEAVRFTTMINAAAGSPVLGKYDINYDTQAFTNFGSSGLGSYGQYVLDVAQVNLCIGRTINEQFQFGSTLLMTGADQRLLHETVRERAQLAMQQLSDVGVVLSNFPTNVNEMTLLIQWLEGKGGVSIFADTLVGFATSGLGPNGASPSSVTAAWASDLNDAARLQAKATEDLSGLLVRSGAAQDALPGSSATAPRCGAAGGTCDDLGPGSWRQRALALLYGGDPLDSAGTPGEPAVETNGSTVPGLPWPSAAELPYATHAIPAGANAPPASWTPGALQFLRVAQRFDVLTLLMNAGTTVYSSPSNIALAQTTGNGISDAAYWLYLDLEAAIESTACTPVAASDAGPGVTCPTIDATSLQGRTFPLSTSTAAHVPDLTKLTGWQAWQNYELRPEDAQELVSVLAQQMPATNAQGGLLLKGGTDLRTLPGRNTPSLHLASGASLMPHSLLEAGTIYGRFGRHRLPKTFNDSTLMEALYVGAVDNYTGVILDQGRVMGSVPALAELREAAWAINAGTNPAGQSFKAQTGTLTALVAAAIGDSQTSLMPVEASLDVAGVTTSVQAVGPTIAAPGALNGATTRQWMVHVLPTAQDAAPGGFWTDSLSNYTVFAVIDNPQAMEAVADPTGVRNGFSTLAQVLAATDGTVQTSTELAREPSGVLSAVVNLPESVPGGSTVHNVVLVARHREGHAFTFKALSGVITPWATGALASDKKTVVPLPGDDQFFATGGSLTGLGLRASATLPTDPATPMFDGFGNPRNVLPTRAGLTVSGTSPQPQLTWWTDTMAHSQAPLQGVTTNFNQFVADMKTSGTDAQKVVAAQQTELSSINGALVQLCGGVTSAGGSGTIDVNDAGVIEPASGCNITFVHVNSMGPTAAEMQAMGCSSTAGAPQTTPSLDWPQPTNCMSLGTTPSMHDKVACSLAPFTNAFAFQVEVAQPVACAAWTRGATFGTGTLGQALSAQAGAYWGYRDAVNALDQEGLAVIAQAGAADGAVATAKAAYAAEQLVAQANMLALSQAVQNAVTAVSQDQVTVNDKTAELNDLGSQVTASTVMSGVAAGAGTGAAIGGAIGTIFPGIGTAIGGAVGAIVGGIAGGLIAAFQGPTQEQIDQATDALNRAKAQLAKDQQILNEASAAEDAGDAANMAQVAASATAASGAAATAAATAAQGIAAFTAQMATTMAAGQTLLSSSIAIHNDVMTTALDIQLAQLTYTQVVSAARVDYGIMAEFDANVVFNLTADLDAARSALIDARHLLEFTYGTSFSSTTMALPGGVAAPNVWVDQIYDYDLTSLRAVYGTTGGNPQVIDGQKLTDYYNNLNQLNQDYLTENNALPYLNGTQQEQFIAGPSATTTVQVVTDAGTTTSTVPDPGAGAWSVLCDSRAACTAAGNLWCAPPAGVKTFSQVCASAANVDAGQTPTYYPPLGAKVRFSLDRWGYMTPPGSVPNQPTLVQGVIGALNGRWSRVAVNVIGTSGQAILTCNGTCPGLDTVNYNLSQLGPYTVTGFDAVPRFLPVPTIYGQTPNAPAVSALQLVNGQAPDNGSARTLGAVDPTGVNIDAFMRSDFVGTPLAGDYELDLWAAPNQDLGQITSVQLIVEPFYWTASPPASQSQKK